MDSTGPTQLPPLISCLAQESVSIPSGGEVAFTETYKFANFGEIEQIKVSYRELQSKQLFQQTLGLDTDWILCFDAINR